MGAQRHAQDKLRICFALAGCECWTGKIHLGWQLLQQTQFGQFAVTFLAVKFDYC